MSSQEMLMKYPAGHASALIAVVFFAVLSLAAIVFVFLRFSWFSSRAIFFKRGANTSREGPVQERAFFQTQLGAYTASLLFSNFLGSIAFMFNIQWINHGGVMKDSLCLSQGILSQVSDIANAYFVGTIAIHSFNTLVLRNRLSVWVCGSIVAFGWLLSIIVGVLPSVADGSSGPIYGYNGLYCGISEVYTTAQVILRLVPICLAALVSAVFYVLVYLILRGSLVINDGVKFNLDHEARKSVVVASGDSLEYRHFIGTIVRSMLWYPVAYVGLLLWSIVVLFMQVSGGQLPFAFKVFASTCSAMLGLANALIILNTLRILAPMLQGPSATKQKDDVENFYSGAKARAFSFMFGNSRNTVSISEKTLPPLPPPSAGSPRGMPLTENGIPSAKLPTTPPSKGALRGKHAPSNSRTPLLPRNISPVSELEAKLALPEYTRDVGTVPFKASMGLPAAPRLERSVVVREDTLASDESTLNDVPLTAVDIGTTAPTMYGSPSRDSFISLYASRSPTSSSPNSDRLPLPVPWRSGASHPSLASVNTDITRFPAFASPLPDRGTSPSPPGPSVSSVNRVMHQHTSEDDVDPPAASALSPPSWAALVGNAAKDRRSRPSAAPRTRRRSHTLNEFPPVPPARVRAPLPVSPRPESAFLDGPRSRPSPPVIVREGPARIAVPHEEPQRVTSRTPMARPYDYF
ncbi:hypothetical protein B0H21DRAFT_826639 [Amylocystis lapponica]|nr:hypothetical protein B0H21DRAFT_826639 [Amylocystis lapponica]